MGKKKERSIVLDFASLAFAEVMRDQKKPTTQNVNCSKTRRCPLLVYEEK